MIKRFILNMLLALFVAALHSQNVNGELSVKYAENANLLPVGQNELTIYVIPSTVKYDWSSPRALYKSYFKNCKRNLFKKNKYLLGHAFMELSTTREPERIFTGMRSASRKDQKELVFKQHYGLAILGAGTKGKLETDSDLELKVKKYSQKGQLAFMTFFISDEATDRMIEFFQAYETAFDSSCALGIPYGGAFWPRYKGEGAGCSAFVVSFLDLAGLLREEFDKWMVKINIPMDLIGGPYNNFQEVKFSDVKKRKTWAGSCVTDTSDFEHFEIYDPSLMYEWIQDVYDNQFVLENISVTPLQLNDARGILIDGRDMPVPLEEYIFIDREKPSLFLNYYHPKIENSQ